MNRRLALALILTAVPSLRAADDPTAAAILDRYVEVTGGRDLYEKRKSEIMTAKLEFAAAGISGKIVRYSAAPDHYYSSMELPGVGTVEMGVSDGIAWEKSAILGPRIKTGAERAEAVREAQLNSTANWAKLYAKVSLEGTEKVDGEDCYKVLMTPNDGNAITMYFQKKSGLAVKTTTTAASQLGEIPVIVTVADYKNFNGIWVPAKTTQKAAGQEFTITVEKVEENAEIPADKFALPAEIKALAAKGGK